MRENRPLRSTRGFCVTTELYSIKGILIHGDLNAVYNIIKKAIPEAFVNGIEGTGLYPRSLSIKQMITSKGLC